MVFLLNWTEEESLSLYYSHISSYFLYSNIAIKIIHDNRINDVRDNFTKFFLDIFSQIMLILHSFIHSGYFYGASSSSLLLIHSMQTITCYIKEKFYRIGRLPVC